MASSFTLANLADITGGANIPQINNQSAGNYIILAADTGKWVRVGGFTYTLSTTSSYGTPFAVLLLNTSASNATLVATSGSFLGAGGATSLTLLPGTWAWCNSDGTNWVTVTK